MTLTADRLRDCEYGKPQHTHVSYSFPATVAWTVATAREHESTFVAGLLDTVRNRGFAAETCALDKGYDNGRVYRECTDRLHPLIPRETPAGPRSTGSGPC